MRLTVRFQNLCDGGEVGGPRWARLAARLTEGGRPDVVALAECRGWDAHDQALLHRASADLGLVPAGLATVRSLDGQPCAILYNPQTMGERPDWFDGFAFHHGAGVAVFTPPALGGRRLHIGVGHLDPYSRTAARIEAETLCARLVFPPEHDPLALLCADFNSPPLAGPAPDPARLYPGTRAARTDLADPFGSSTERVVNREIAVAVQNADLLDVAQTLHPPHDDPALSAPTGVAGDRVDRACASPALLERARRYRILGVPGDGTASDHAGIEVAFELPPGQDPMTSLPPRVRRHEGPLQAQFDPNR
ncbi:endonuclease/exonuclease/phosphatase family protein [Glycomyces sp. MUSA5-2]|uniref:endonuclease/exonuclease/phosphatase family protein n=1 Tax=Glycomyces sp. MUSA5-2 TaxID=2053002 RepID=UPI00300B7EBD